MCLNWEEGGRGQCFMGRVSFAPTASLHSLWSLAGGVADRPAPALPAHPISDVSLPAGSSQSSAPLAPSWPAAGCQAQGCQAASAGKPMAGSASRAQPPCSGSGLCPCFLLGKYHLHLCGALVTLAVPPPCAPSAALLNPSARTSLGTTTSSPRALHPPDLCTLPINSGTQILWLALGNEGDGVDDVPPPAH